LLTIREDTRPINHQFRQRTYLDLNAAAQATYDGGARSL
jgi:hypothetical protein